MNTVTQQELELGQIEKNPKLVVSVSLSYWKDKRYVCIREKYQNGKGEWIHTQKGTNININRLDDLIAILQDGKLEIEAEQKQAISEAQ
jgi:predicted transcriptional regulator